MKKLNTDLDVWVEDFPRRAGVESGRLHNTTWLDCPFSVEPASTPLRGFQRGFAWTATFRAVDDPSQERVFKGLAETRAVARYAAIDALTKYISFMAKHRHAFIARQQIAEKLSVDAGIPLAE